MERDSSSPLSNEQLIKLADALGNMRDSLMMVSLALTDFVTEMPPPALRVYVFIQTRSSILTLVHLKNRTQIPMVSYCLVRAR